MESNVIAEYEGMEVTVELTTGTVLSGKLEIPQSGGVFIVIYEDFPGPPGKQCISPQHIVSIIANKTEGE